MNFKTNSLVVVLIISMFVLSGCEVYDVLYGTSPESPTGEVTGSDSDEEELFEEDIPLDSEDSMDDDSEMMDKDDSEMMDSEEEMMDDEESDSEMEEEDIEDSDAMFEEDIVEDDDAMEEDDLVVVGDVSDDTTEVEETEEDTQVTESSGKPVVVVVQENELVSLVPKAEDPDSDTTLSFTFTSPLSSDGEWQTRYGDAGEYTVTVTASDGELTTTKDVLIIVNKKEEEPVIDFSKPIESALVIDETDSVEFSVEASDLNNDPLDYTWKVDGVEIGSEPDFVYQTTFEDAGTHTIKVDVSDELASASKIWSVEVANVNRKPVLEPVDDIFAKETDIIIITALATDDDEDTIEYSISDDRFEQDENVFTWETDYASAGVYEVTLSADDGQDVTEETFTVEIENVNRAPVIVDILQS